MMFHVKILKRAEADTDRIYLWIAKRSPDGAGRWFRAFLAAADTLKLNAARYGSAAEASVLGSDIREHFFKTPRGRVYRMIYLIVGDEARVLRVRGPGQAPLAPGDASPTNDA